MTKPPTYYGTRALGNAVGVSDKTAWRFLKCRPADVDSPHEPRSWHKLDATQFESAVAQLKELQKIQPNHPLRALRAK